MADVIAKPLRYEESKDSEGGPSYEKTPAELKGPLKRRHVDMPFGLGSYEQSTVNGVVVDPDSVRSSKTAKVGGIVLKANDTGRVLLIQRSITNRNNVAMGEWEWPGGKCEDGEDAWDAAKREWQEEVGVNLPDGKLAGSWTSGRYTGFVWVCDHESDLGNPRGLEDADNEVENVAWWDPNDLPANPAVRLELATTDWALVAHARKGGHEWGEAGARGLRRWYNEGALGQIKWGEPGDFDRCVVIASKYMSDEQAKGFCNLRHHDALGIYPATHAEELEGAEKGPKEDPADWPGAKYDLQIAERYAALLQGVISGSVTGVKTTVEQCFAACASLQMVKAQSPLRWAIRSIVQWITRRNINIDPDSWLGLLKKLVEEAYLAGVAAAHTAAGNPKWSTWTPGDPETAELPRGSGLADLLAQAEVSIKGMSNTLVARIGNAIADGIEAGQNMADVATSVNDVVSNPSRSMVIARTETARAMVVGDFDAYSQLGVEQWNWLTGHNPCPTCVINRENGPYQVGSGPAMPAHPNCRCAPVPVVPGFTVKGFNPNEPRVPAGGKPHGGEWTDQQLFSVDLKTDYFSDPDSLRVSVESGLDEDFEPQHLGAGSFGSVYKIKFKDGSYGIIKLMSGEYYINQIMENSDEEDVDYDVDVSPMVEQDVEREVLAAEVARAIGAPVPACIDEWGDILQHMEDVDDHVEGAVVQRFVAGKTAAEMRNDLHGRAEAQSSPEGRMLGVLDHLLANPDRNPYNWFITPKGTPVGIDHGLAFNMDPDWGGVMTPFVPPPKKELYALRDTLTKLRPVFKQRKREAWWKLMMNQYEALIRGGEGILIDFTQSEIEVVQRIRYDTKLTRGQLDAVVAFITRNMENNVGDEEISQNLADWSLTPEQIGQAWTEFNKVVLHI